MKERPIIFSGEMVRAILDGRKTQTRRVMRLQPFDWAKHVVPYPCDKLPGYGEPGVWLQASEDYHKACGIGRCPYGVPGDRLYVRETWGLDPDMDRSLLENGDTPADIDATEEAAVGYRADQSGAWFVERWRPSIHMPRWASRITLEVKGIRVERVQDISNSDAEAEGVKTVYMQTERTTFRELWDSINAKRGYGWNANPWVWVIEFERINNA